MNTTTLNPSATGGTSKDSKNQGAKVAGAAVGAAALGAAAGHFASKTGEPEAADADEVLLAEEVIEEAVEPSDEQANEQAQQHTQEPAPTAPHHSDATASAAETTVVEPQPVTDDTDVAANVTPGTANGGTATADTSQTAENVTPGQGEDASAGNVNPDDIADAIIAESHIDPNDIDMADVINFDEIGTVYTVDGESYMAATFHDEAGNNLVMIDVDGDNVFDVITDTEGNLLAEVPGNISIGDAEEDIADPDEYLAYDSETDNVDEFGDDTLADDIMA